MKKTAPQRDWIDDAIGPLPPLVTAEATQELLHVRRRKLNYMVQHGELDSFRHRAKGASPLMITRASIERYLRATAEGVGNAA